MHEKVTLRQAVGDDVRRVLRLQNRLPLQRPPSTAHSPAKIKQLIETGKVAGFVAEAGEVVGVVLATIEWGQRLARIGMLTVDPELESADDVTRDLLGAILHTLDEAGIDVIYGVNFDENKSRLAELQGFRVTGVLPDTTHTSKSGMGALLIRFREGVLARVRAGNFSLHPALSKVVALSAARCGLPGETRASIAPDRARLSVVSLPVLELLEAPEFATHRMAKLLQTRRNASNFYPLEAPNAVITDPEQEIEVFVNIRRDARFASIIGEHLERSVDPVQLYGDCLQLLFTTGISDIEVINDASDTEGNDQILASGFAPSGYFPAYRLEGGARHDYAVFIASNRPPSPLDSKETGEVEAFVQAYEQSRNALGGDESSPPSLQ